MPKLIGKFWAALAVAAAAILGPSEAAWAIKPFSYIYIPESSAGVSDIAVLDTDTNSVITKIPLGNGVAPLAGAVSPDGRTIYLATGNTVAVIDAVANAVTSTINVGPGPSGFPSIGIAVTPDGSKVYSTNAAGALVDIATSTNSVISTIPLGLASFQTGAGVAISANGTKVYVALPSLGSVAVIDTSTDTVTGTISLGGQPAELALTPDGAKLYVTTATTVVVADTNSRTVIKTIPVPPLLFTEGAIAVTPDGSRVFVGTGGAVNLSSPDTNSTTTVIATATDTIVDTISAGLGVIAVTPDGAHAYVTGNSRLLMIDTATDKAVKAITGVTPAIGNPQPSMFSGPFRSRSTLQVAKGGSGSGIVSSNLPGITCGTTCSGSFGTGSVVTLTATAASGSTFTGWSGDCAGMSDCTITLRDDTSVTASFAAAPAATNALSVSLAGTGSGTVRTTSSGLDCGAICTASYGTGSNIALFADADPGSIFVGWSGGGCSGNATCTVPLNADSEVTASFARVPIPNTLIVRLAGLGAVASTNQPGINCGQSLVFGAGCAASYPAGTTVTLEAQNSGASFTGWSGGGCSGTSTCTVTLAADTTVVANFAPQLSTAYLTLGGTGTGSGRILSNPSGAYCVKNDSGGCGGPFQFAAGTMITLTPQPDPGSSFTGWSGGGCTGTSPCTVTLFGGFTTITGSFGFTAPNATLSVSAIGTGSGAITSNPAGINCTADCTTSLSPGASIVLTATPASGSVFLGWDGDCFGTASCVLTLTHSKSVTAQFGPAPFNDTLSVSFAGAGAGSVTLNPGGISCGPNCSPVFPDGTQITLVAFPALGSVFAGWSGSAPCITLTPPACLITLRTDTSLVATFQPAASLKVVTSAPVSVLGTMVSAVCSSTCSYPLAIGSQVTLQPMPLPGSGQTFQGWNGGGCSGLGGCAVTVNGDVTVTANFTVINHMISVSRAGAGSGTVTGSSAGIACGTVCSGTIANGAPILLSATPAAGSIFTGWSGGGCSGTGSCFLAPTADAAVTANFAVSRHLQLVGNGSGSGFVTSISPAFACPGTCSGTYPDGTVLTFQAAPATGSDFLEWGGCNSTNADNGIPTCSVILNRDATITATFVSFKTLTISKVGPGSVSSFGGGLNCGALCSGSFQAGTMLTLTATPTPGEVFTGWSGGGCSGTGPCVVVLNADTTVTANFDVTVRVSQSGTGTGTITSAPSGITCGAICSAPFAVGRTVNLTAAAADGSTFSGWSGGGCAGTGPCSIPPLADVAVTANFTLLPTTAMLSVTKTGNGTVSSTPSGIGCGPTCNASFKIGSTIALGATPDPGSIFVGWSGGNCSGNQGCAVTMTADTVVTAHFVPASATSITLAAAILPSSRSVQIGATATLFGTLINAGPGTVTYCTVAPATSMAAGFFFQTTDPATNGLIGTVNTPVDIPEGKAQSFLLAFTPNAAFNPTDVAFSFSCSNAAAAASYSGVNTLLLSSSASPVPDIVAIAGTTTNDGTLHIAGQGASAAFAVAIANVGSSAQITAIPDSGGANLPLSFGICQTNQTTGACLASPAPSVLATVNNNTTASFGIFATANATIPFLPAVNRITVRFVDAGSVIRGSTSVAVRTQ